MRPTLKGTSTPIEAHQLLGNLGCLDFNLRASEGRISEARTHHDSKEFNETFERRVKQLQEDGRMLKPEEIRTEPERVSLDIQLEMVYEYTCRQLGLPWSFATEYDYGRSAPIYPSLTLSEEAYTIYKMIMHYPEDRDFLYKCAQFPNREAKEVIKELQCADWIEENADGLIKAKHPEHFIQPKHFFEP